MSNLPACHRAFTYSGMKLKPEFVKKSKSKPLQDAYAKRF
jgi:hypothetical protein